MRGNKLTWFLGVLVVLLSSALVLQTAYLVWLHRELYVALNGKTPALADLQKTLGAELDALTGISPREETTPQFPVGDRLGLQEQAERMLEDPSQKALLRELLRDLGMGVEPQTTPEMAFRPRFDFSETPTRYVVTLELPNFEESDIDAAVDRGVLRVSGKQQGTKFRESFAFPGPVVAGTESISFGKGKLIVSVVKEKAVSLRKGSSS